MTGTDEDVRVDLYRTLATMGRAPSAARLAASTGLGEDDVRAALRRLADGRHLVLDQDSVVLAHPFATVPLGFSVMGSSTLWWGGCAWDSFALPHLLRSEPDVLVATRCPACDRALSWVVGRREAPSGEEVAHFLVPVARIWDDVVHSCAHQRLFCDEECVASWSTRTGRERGYVMDLATLWRLAAHWYDGRLDHGYTRRDPSSAAAYFRSVGLRGSFWGLSDG